MLSANQIAKICYETDRAFNAVVSSNIGLSWEDCPQRSRNEAISNVRYLIDNQTAPASDIHERWLKTQRDLGWTWADEYNKLYKCDPMVTHFNKLTPRQQLRINLFGTIVRMCHKKKLSDTARTLLDMLDT